MGVKNTKFHNNIINYFSAFCKGFSAKIFGGFLNIVFPACGGGKREIFLRHLDKFHNIWYNVKAKGTFALKNSRRIL